MAITLIYAGLEKPYRASIEVSSDCKLTLLSFLTEYLPDQVVTLIDGDQIRAGYAILVDGRNATQVGELEAVIRDGFTLLITTHTVGG